MYTFENRQIQDEPQKPQGLGAIKRGSEVLVPGESFPRRPLDPKGMLSLEEARSGVLLPQVNTPALLAGARPNTGSSQV